MKTISFKKNKKSLIKIIILFAAILAGAGVFFHRVSSREYIEEKIRQSSLPPAKSFSGVENSLEKNKTVNVENKFENIPIVEIGDDGNNKVSGEAAANAAAAEKFPAEFNLAVPFTSQAPFAVWDELHDDACEEASVAMVNAFYKNYEFTPQSADDEIFSIVDWETRVFGYWKDTNVKETARILHEKYGYKNVRVVYDIGIDDIKREVARGSPIILPAAGQLLGNKYFRQPGPLYHMLVVRGWTKSGMIITNDPGTKRGEGYLYEPDILLNAVHDWNGGDVFNGRKAMIVVEK
jgi:hypothetical protein